MSLISHIFSGEDLPIFPVAETYLAAVHDRVILARKIDVEELRIRRKKADMGWLIKSAKEMDILLEDESDVSENDFSYEFCDAKQIKAHRDLKHLKDALKHLLSKPIFPKGLSYKYPSSVQIDSEGQVGNLFEGNLDKKAVNVMKNVIKKNNKNQNA